MLDEELLKILACPKTRAPLIEIDGWLYSTDAETRLRYPIRDGIPIMLIEEAEVVEPDEFARVMAEAKKNGNT
ncbi:MAG: hypothetical protein IIB59_02805 [Planctomycetes bacterium]|nr:hypothetical protein [Planctomycetota bacterium]